MHWSVLAKVNILSQTADLPFPRKCPFCILGHFWHMITSSMRSPQPPALLCNLCFVTFLECSKSNGMFLKVLAKNLDCEKKTHKKYFCVWLPHAICTNNFSLLTKCLTKSAWSQLGTEANTFVHEVFGHQTFICKQGNLQNWCWQQDVLNESMNSASFSYSFFVTPYGYSVLRSHSDLDWNQVQPKFSQK